MLETKFSLQSPRSKPDWTREIFFHYQTATNTAPPKDIEVLFWYNLNANKGFRLTHRGFEIIKNLGYQIYHHKIDVKTYPMTSELFVLMDRNLHLPWFWNNKSEMALLDKDLSIMLELSGGNLRLSVENTG
jgi:hypothetical protein